jgi:hypothetical protein
VTVPLVLLQESVACHVRVKVFEQLLDVGKLSVKLGVTGPSQLSEAVGALKLGV